MQEKFFRHARKRMRQRNIGTGRAHSALGGGNAQYLGRHKFKTTKLVGGRTVTVIFRKDRGRKVAITAWKK